MAFRRNPKFILVYLSGFDSRSAHISWAQIQTIACPRQVDSVEKNLQQLPDIRDRHKGHAMTSSGWKYWPWNGDRLCQSPEDLSSGG
jgi:hypothetical protein